MQEYEYKSVSTASLFDFCKLTQQMILDGWEFNFTNNEMVPMVHGQGLVFYCVMQKKAVLTSNMGEFTLEAKGTLETEEETKRRGRKPKTQESQE